MRRREFITLLGGAAAAWPIAARAQQPNSLPRIGFIQNFRSENFEALIEGLHKAGYVDGQTVLMETRLHGAVLDRIDEFARELVALKCSVIFAAAPYAIQAAIRATNTIPIVGVDPAGDARGQDGH
jgi:putative tryptophan/tyrosine transport system substrate-binding protein